MEKSQANDLEWRAYREAGHATMSYLIRQGFMRDFVPIDRSLVLPRFTSISIDDRTADWAEITSNLGSLMTAAQVLLAGYLAEQLRADPNADLEPSATLRMAREMEKTDREQFIKQVQSVGTWSPTRNRLPYETALHLISAYLGENGDLEKNPEKLIKLANENYAVLYMPVVKTIRSNWIAVEALARALLQSQTLTETETFNILDQQRLHHAK